MESLTQLHMESGKATVTKFLVGRWFIVLASHRSLEFCMRRAAITVVLVRFFGNAHAYDVGILPTAK